VLSPNPIKRKDRLNDCVVRLDDRLVELFLNLLITRGSKKTDRYSYGYTSAGIHAVTLHTLGSLQIIEAWSTQLHILSRLQTVLVVVVVMMMNS
jgi:Iap family predicted aminopeptidase